MPLTKEQIEEMKAEKNEAIKKQKIVRK